MGAREAGACNRLAERPGKERVSNKKVTLLDVAERLRGSKIRGAFYEASTVEAYIDHLASPVSTAN